MDPVTGNVIMILCLTAGTALVILEAFIPGFGVAGFFGVAMEVAGVVSAWMHHGTAFAAILTFAVLAVIGTAIWLSYRSAMKGRISRSPLILKDTQEAAAGTGLQKWQNRDGAAVTALRPSGFIEIDGQRLSAASEGEWIAKGARVKVTGAEGGQLTVRTTD